MIQKQYPIAPRVQNTKKMWQCVIYIGGTDGTGVFFHFFFRRNARNHDRDCEIGWTAQKGPRIVGVRELGVSHTTRCIRIMICGVSNPGPRYQQGPRHCAHRSRGVCLYITSHNGLCPVRQVAATTGTVPNYPHIPGRSPRSVTRAAV